MKYVVRVDIIIDDPDTDKTAEQIVRDMLTNGTNLPLEDDEFAITSVEKLSEN